VVEREVVCKTVSLLEIVRLGVDSVNRVSNYLVPSKLPVGCGHCPKFKIIRACSYRP